MATFQPILNEPKAIINVREGVVDESAAQWLTLAGKTGLELGAARAQAQLTGAEATAAEVDPGRDYGQFTETFVGPFADPDAAVELQLNRDLDLTRIAAARKQGALSPERTRAAVNLALKEAINRNPLFAGALRERAERFLQAGAGGTQGSGSIFAETHAEKLERTLMESQAKAMQQEEIEAAQIGRTVEELRDIKYIFSERDLAKARMEIMSERQSVFVGDVADGLGRQLSAANLEVLGSLSSAVQQGGYNPQSVQVMKAGINNTRLQMMNQLYSVRGRIPGEEWNRLKADVDHWAEAANTLVDDADFASLVSRMSTTLDNAVNITAKTSFPELAVASTFGDAAVEMQLRALSDPSWAGPLESVDRRFKFLRERSDLSQGMLNNFFAGILGGSMNPEHPVPSPGELSIFGYNILAGRLQVPHTTDGSDRRVKEGAVDAVIRGSLIEGDTRPLSIFYRDPGVIAEARTNEHMQAGIRNAVQRHGSVASRMMREAGLSLDDFNISIDESGPGRSVSVEYIGEPTAEEGFYPELYPETDADRIRRFAARDAAKILKETLSLAHTYPEIPVGETGLQDWLYDNLRRGGGIPRVEVPAIERQGRRVPERPTDVPDLPPQAIPRTWDQLSRQEQETPSPTEVVNQITPEQRDLILAEPTLAGKRRVIRELGIEHPDIEAIVRRFEEMNVGR